MRHYSIICAAVLLASAASAFSCGRKEETVATVSRIVISPTLTRVTEDRFEPGDAIGVNIVLPSGPFFTNERMEYNGSWFSSDLEWYEGRTVSTVTAWYPYSASVPRRFTVQTDQSRGLSSSDFVAGSQSRVTPSETPVPMTFTHRMSRVEIKVVNNTGKTFGNLCVGGVVAEAALSDAFVAEAVESASEVEITPCLMGDRYYLIIPPQTASLVLSFTLDGTPRSVSIPSAVFTAGTQSSIELTETSAKLAGVINNWWNENRPLLAYPTWYNSDPGGYNSDPGGPGDHVDYSIAIDGDFSDWDALTARTADGYYGICCENTDRELNSLLRLKLCSDSQNIYVYTEIDYKDIYVAEGGPFSQGDDWYGFRPSHPGTPGTLVIYIGTDDNHSGAFAARYNPYYEESFWDYSGFDAFPQYYFCYDVARGKMQFGWNENHWPQHRDGWSDDLWGKPLSDNGQGWWGSDLEGTWVWDNTVSDERTFKFSDITVVEDPVTRAGVSVVKMEFAMDRRAIDEYGVKVNGPVVIGALYENVSQEPRYSSEGSGKLPSGRTPLTLYL